MPLGRFFSTSGRKASHSLQKRSVPM